MLPELVVEKKKLSELMPAGYNPRSISPEAFEGLKKSISRFGLVEPIVWNKRTGNVVGGHQRLKVLQATGVEETSVIVVELGDKEEVALNITLNNPSVKGHWTDGVQGLLESIPEDMKDDISASDLKEWLSENTDIQIVEKDEFGVPFDVDHVSIIDGKLGNWQERKKLWKKLGIQSEIGRGKALTFAHRSSDGAGDFVTKKILRGDAAGTSIFDPVLCEIVYRRYCPAGGRILDPFAGGSVRGVVAAKLGFKYVGVDLRGEQVEENIRQAERIVPENKPEWVTGDSKNIRTMVDGDFDFVFSCPPYFDLEVYSEKEEDLSTMKWEAFCEVYSDIVAGSVSRLRPGSFCCFVVGDVRDSDGFYRGFVPLTIESFERAGARLYNEMVLITPVGHLALRCGGQFSASRKLGKTHQNVLVFRT